MNNHQTPHNKIKIITLGCKVNQYESDMIINSLKKSGFDCLENKDTQDLLIINTCTVTHKATIQSRQAIRRAIRENPDAIVCATGCYAQSEPHIISKIKGIDYVVGNSHKQKIAEILNPQKPIKNKIPVVICEDILPHRFFEKTEPCSTGKRVRPFIKIQDGCNDFCTYCIVPYTRGPSRSRSIKDILDEINVLISDGANEIVLTGVHIGRYGFDLSPRSSLFDLLNHIIDKTKIHRVRLSSIEPTELTEDILSLALNSKKICPHFHIPLQSGDVDILKRMKRPYSPELFKSLIEKIHQLGPDTAVGADVMVGFPGETDNAFKNTVNLIEALPVSYLHVFPYSRRRMTPASHFTDQIPSDVIKSRLNRLRQIGHAKKNQFYQQMVGQTLEIIVETQRDKASGLLKGVSSNYVKVMLDGGDNLKKQLIPCHILKLLNHQAVLGEF